MDHNAFALIVALSVLLLTSFALAMYYRRKSARLTGELSQAREKLAAAHADMQDLRQRHQDSLDFQKKLTEAELTTRLQQPRLSAQHGYQHITAPERYLYVRSLAQNGMSAREISDILAISTQEAEQLVNLAKLADTSS